MRQSKQQEGALEVVDLLLASGDRVGQESWAGGEGCIDARGCARAGPTAAAAMRTRRPPTLPSQPRSQRPRGGPHTQASAPSHTRGLCGTLLNPTALRRLLALAGLAAFVCMSAMSARLDPFDGGGNGGGNNAEGTHAPSPLGAGGHSAAIPTNTPSVSVYTSSSAGGTHEWHVRDSECRRERR